MPERKHKQQAADMQQQSAIEAMDVGQIEELQKQLSFNYKQFAQEYSKSKMARIAAYVQKIEETQQLLKKQETLYEYVVQNNVPLISEEFSIEQASVSQEKVSKRRKHSISHEVEPHSPPPEVVDCPQLDPLPVFTESFEHVVQPYRSSLTAAKRRYHLRSTLIEDDALKNKDILWRQSAKELADLRRSKRQQLAMAKFKLEEDYSNAASERKLILLEQRYRASIRKVGEKKSRSDLGQMSEDLKLRDKNRKKYKDGESIINPLSRASDNDIEMDLTLMRSSNVKVQIIEANHLYMEQPLKKEIQSGPTTMTDLVNSEIESKTSFAQVSYQPPMTLGQLQLQQQGQPTTPFTMPPPPPLSQHELPGPQMFPIGAFPPPPPLLPQNGMLPYPPPQMFSNGMGFPTFMGHQ